MKHLLKWLKYVILSVVAIITLIPVIYVLFYSFKSNQELITGGGLLPRKWVFSNYSEVWKELNFSLYFYNSVVFATISSGLSVFMGAMSGYVFARTQFPGKRLLSLLIIGVMFVSLGPMTLFPKFKLAVDWGLTNSIFTIPLAALYGLGASVFLYEGFVKSLGKEMDEAAIVDGASYFKRFYRLTLPLMAPITATFFLLEFIAEWNNYIFPLVMSIGNPDTKTLTVGVVELRNMGSGAAAWNLLLAGSMISVIPVLVVFIVLNRQIVGGLAQGAVKG
ncbi:carbohydrate ABC transporter permease [Paenibacillus alba]|uniref:Carbohydrate ABC transporter permease n=1 Tax=Paenibacillus alba TaxID=1197127 RepID=A0ABU6G0M7_9BACL|nr:carbohydrate ABC transporter permease [Paenibacillus alba]MEC0227711.1 carbohydrate ABC transporter permease [Paenibacillus alba]NQX69958.1 carbohydrate ABC transporter permease [Paenibacillus alba]